MTVVLGAIAVIGWAIIRATWAARGVVVPVAAAAVANSYGLGLTPTRALLAVVLALALAIGVMPGLRPQAIGLVTGWPRRVALRLAWVSLCEEHGWKSKSGKRAKLLSIRPDGPGVDIITIEVPAGYEEDKYTALLDELAVARNYADKVMLQTPKRRVVRGRFSSRRLPEMVPYFATCPAEPDESKIYLGLRADRRRWVVDLKHSPHLAMVGQTGGGKTSLLDCVLYHAGRMGWRVTIIDPKGDGPMSRWEQFHFVQIIRDPGDTGLPFFGALESAIADMHEVQDDTLAAQLPTIADHPGFGEGLRRTHVVIVDELNDVARLSAKRPVFDGRAPALDADGAPIMQNIKIIEYLGRLAAKGRSARTMLVLAGQSMPTQSLPTEVRGNLVGRIILPCVKEVREHLLGASLATDPDVTAAARSGIPGRVSATGTMRDASPRDAWQAQVAYDETEVFIADLKARGLPFTTIEPDYRMPDEVTTP